MVNKKDFFRKVMGQFATGVTVVTARSQGKVAGLTVNAFCSVSLNPPLILVCVDLNSHTLPFIRESGALAVNILSKEQEHLSSCFATTTEERYEYFCHASYHTAVTASPILDGAIAFIDSRVIAEYPGGDHVIFLAQVEALGADGQLIFAQEENREDRQHADLPGDNGNRRSIRGTRDTGGVESVTPPENDPLVYFQGKYRHLGYNYSKPSLEKQPEGVRD
ncbi:MAG: flavin reductase family protein [Chloroflexota bacterium]|nr:flavin reductase family protein [Chloroflexota bacterium]